MQIEADGSACSVKPREMQQETTSGQARLGIERRIGRHHSERHLGGPDLPTTIPRVVVTTLFSNRRHPFL